MDYTIGVSSTPCLVKAIYRPELYHFPSEDRRSLSYNYLLCAKQLSWISLDFYLRMICARKGRAWKHRIYRDQHFPQLTIPASAQGEQIIDSYFFFCKKFKTAEYLGNTLISVWFWAGISTTTFWRFDRTKNATVYSPHDACGKFIKITLNLTQIPWRVYVQLDFHSHIRTCAISKWAYLAM